MNPSQWPCTWTKVWIYAVRFGMIPDLQMFDIILALGNITNRAGVVVSCVRMVGHPFEIWPGKKRTPHLNPCKFNSLLFRAIYISSSPSPSFSPIRDKKKRWMTKVATRVSFFAKFGNGVRRTANPGSTPVRLTFFGTVPDLWTPITSKPVRLAVYPFGKDETLIFD